MVKTEKFKKKLEMQKDKFKTMYNDTDEEHTIVKTTIESFGEEKHLTWNRVRAYKA